MAAEYYYKLKTKMEKANFHQEEMELVLQYVDRLTTNNVPVIFDLTHLSTLLDFDRMKLEGFIRYCGDYRVVRIPKKYPGAYRELHVPSEQLKRIQRWILKYILSILPISQFAKGFQQGLSIVHNAAPHVRKECVINLDIKNFYPSICTRKVYDVFRYVGYTKEVSYALTRLCSFYGNGLPQGAPTSPYLSNLVCKKMDKRLSILADKCKASYTRYADDITFSGDREIVKYLFTIKKIVSDEGYEINDDKTRIQYRHARQMVTGLTVNEKVRTPRSISKKLREAIYYCGRYGVSNHLLAKGIEKSNFKDHLFGMAYYIKMVNKEEGEKYIRDLNKIEWGY